MTIGDHGKLIVLVVMLLGAFVLVAMGRVEWEALDQVVAAGVFFVVGNGHLAVRKGAPVPTLTTSAERLEAQHLRDDDERRRDDP